MKTSYHLLSAFIGLLILITNVICRDYIAKNKRSNSKSTKKTAKFNFNIDWFTASPDGVERKILGANGDFPPVIRVKGGQKVQLNLKNNISEHLVDIHFHGMHQKGSLTSDGFSSVTQCPVNKGEIYKYKFNTGTQTGTFWYHAHHAMTQLEGLKGAFIVEDDPKSDPFLKPYNTYISKKFTNNNKKVFYPLFYVDHSKCNKEPDTVMFLTDWYHLMADEVEAQAKVNPDTLLINGQGDYLCTNPPCKSLFDFNIVRGKAMKIRFINASSLVAMHIHIEKHLMTIVECDGITLDGETTVETLRLHVGQRCSVIVRADQEPAAFWVRVTIDPYKLLGPKPSGVKYDGYAKMQYVDSHCKVLDSTSTSDPQTTLQPVIDESLSTGRVQFDHSILSPSSRLYNPPPKNAEKRIFMRMNTVRVGSKFIHTFNDVAFDHRHDTTLLGQLLNYKDIHQTEVRDGITWGYNPVVFDVVTDFIFQNNDGGAHPLHMHGHNCFVMYQGEANSGIDKFVFEYNPSAPLRDVAVINGKSALVYRCIPDNPGIWAFHCHMAFHHMEGLMFTLLERSTDIRKLYGNLAEDLLTCKTTGHIHEMSFNGHSH